MDMKSLTPTVILILIGCVFLFLSLIGGDQGITVPVSIPPIQSIIARAMLFPIGILLLFWGIFLTMTAKTKKIIKTGTFSLAMAFIIIFESYLVISSRILCASPKKIEIRYSFETGEDGWIPQDYEDSQACTLVVRTSDKAFEGKYSLKLMMDLIEGHDNKSKGEAWVNMEDDPPEGIQIPINLKDIPITMSIFAPSGSKGSRKKPNGFQIFVKDENWNSQYSKWHNITQQNKWEDFSFAPSSTKPKGMGSYMDDDFDPTKIIAIGLKMGTGKKSKSKYNGSIYLDAVKW